MMYDIYEQQEQTQDDIGSRAITRYHTESKEKAFKFMDAKNRLAGKNIWRVAVQLSDRLIFDIDSIDMDNVQGIIRYYSKLFSISFKVIKTLHGFHLISESYTSNVLWQYDLCRVLNPLLESPELQQYVEAIESFYKTERDKQKINGLLRDDFIPYFTKSFKESSLYFGFGNFDILFAVNVIMKGYYCLRISKKSIDDKPIEITI